MTELVKIAVVVEGADKARRELQSITKETEKMVAAQKQLSIHAGMAQKAGMMRMGGRNLAGMKNIGAMSTANHESMRAIADRGKDSILKTAAATNVMSNAMKELTGKSGIATKAVSMLAGGGGMGMLASAIVPLLGAVGLPALGAALAVIPVALGPVLVIFEAFKGIGTALSNVWGRFQKVLEPIMEKVRKQLAPAFVAFEKALHPLIAQIGALIEVTLPIAVPIIKGFIFALAGMIRFIAGAGKLIAYAFDYLTPLGLARIRAGEKPVGQIMGEWTDKMDAMMKADNMPKSPAQNPSKWELGPLTDPDFPNKLAEAQRKMQKPVTNYQANRILDGALGWGH